MFEFLHQFIFHSYCTGMRNTVAAREKYTVGGFNEGGCSVLRNLDERLWPFH